PGCDQNDPAAGRCDSSAVVDAKRATHVDDRNKLLVGEPIEERSRSVSIDAAQDDVTSAQLLDVDFPAQVAAEPAYARAEAELLDVARSHLELRHAGVTRSRTHDAADVRALDQVAFHERQGPDSEVRKLYDAQGAGPPETDDADVKAAQRALPVG